MNATVLPMPGSTRVRMRSVWQWRPQVTVELLDHRTFWREPTPGSTSDVLMEIQVAATAPMTMVPTMTMELRSALD